MSRFLAWVVRWLRPRAVRVVVRRAAMEDVELYRALAVQPEHSVLVGVLEVLARLEERILDEFSEPNLPREVKVDGMVAVGIVREARLQILQHVQDAPRVIEEIERRKAEGK